MSGEWAIIEPMEGEEAITDICLLAKKEKAPSGYTVVSIDKKLAMSLIGRVGQTPD